MKRGKNVKKCGTLLILVLIISIIAKIGVSAEESYSVIAGEKSIGTATEIHIDKDYVTPIYRDEKVYFKFTTPEQKGYFDFYGKNINVKTNPVFNDKVVQVHLLNSIGEMQCDLRLFEGGERNKNIELEPSTTYYIEIYNVDYETDEWGNIKFHVQYTSDLVGNTQSDAKYIYLDSKIEGSLDGEEDIDYFKFTTGDYVECKLYSKNISIETGSGFKHYVFVMELYNDVGELLLENRLSKQAEKEGVVKLLPNTNYYIKVYDPSRTMGRYILKVSPNRRNIAETDISYNKTKVYNGKNIKLSVTILDGSYNLVKNKDYKITYSNNKNPGKAKIKIIGIGDYEGTVTKTFVIKPAKVSLKKVKNLKGKNVYITWKKAESVSGYKIQYATNSKLKKGKNNYVKAFAKSKTIKKLQKKKTYYFRVRAYKIIDKKKVYGAWSDIKKVKIRK